MDSLVLDFDAMITQAFSLINALWPVFIVPIGFTLAFGLLGWIVAEVSKAVK